MNKRPVGAGLFRSLEAGWGGLGGLTKADRNVGPPEWRPSGVPAVPGPGDSEAALLGDGSEFCGPNAAWDYIDHVKSPHEFVGPLGSGLIFWKFWAARMPLEIHLSRVRIPSTSLNEVVAQW